MLDQMKAMGALAGLLKNKEKLQELSEQFRARLEGIEVAGAAGGGAVRVTVNGKLEVTSVELAPALASSLGDAPDAAALLIQEATNSALTQARAVVQREAQEMARQMGLPEMPALQGLLN